MGEIVKSERDLTTTYSGLNIFKNSGAFNACGYGVRRRATLSGLNETYFCTVYQPVGGGVPIKYVKFFIGAGATTPGSITAAWWYRNSGSDDLHLVTSEAFAKPTAHWVTGTEYLYELDDNVYLPLIIDRTYYMSIYSRYCQFEATDLGYLRGISLTGDATLISPIAAASQVADGLAVSFESWGDPVAWDFVEDGGGIEQENTDWQTAGYCTGTMTNPANIYGAGSATAGALDEYIALDLGAGITPTTSLIGDEFPAYATSGVRAVSRVTVLMTLASGGVIAVLYSAVDTAAMPDVTGGDWSVLGSEAYSVGTPVTLSIEVPTLARWILIVELGSSVTDAIDTVTVSQIKTKVTDGDFPVSPLDAYHKCWTKNSPIEDTVYKVTAYNAAGAQSEAGDPFTNRKNKD